jgi:hypothetical protein
MNEKVRLCITIGRLIENGATREERKGKINKSNKSRIKKEKRPRYKKE